MSSYDEVCGDPKDYQHQLHFRLLGETLWQIAWHNVLQMYRLLCLHISLGILKRVVLSLKFWYWWANSFFTGFEKPLCKTWRSLVVQFSFTSGSQHCCTSESKIREQLLRSSLINTKEDVLNKVLKANTERLEMAFTF